MLKVVSSPNQSSNSPLQNKGLTVGATPTPAPQNDNSPWNMSQLPAVPAGQSLNLAEEIPALATGAEQLGIGAAKQVGGVANTLSNAANKYIVSPLSKLITGKPTSAGTDIMGAFFGNVPASDLKPTNPLQDIGAGGASVAEFFLPSGLESAATGFLEDAVDAGKFAEKFGPEAGEALSGILKTLGSAGVTGTSMSAVTAAQGGTPSQITESGVLGAGAGVLAKGLEEFGPGIVNSLEKSGFKLTPTQESKMGKQIQAAADFKVNNGILGSGSSAYKELVSVNNQLEDALQSSIGKDITIPTADLENELRQIPDTFKGDKAIYQQVVNDTNNAIDTLKKTEGDTISAQSLLEGKRSYGTFAFGKASVSPKVAKVVSEGDFAIESAYQRTLNKALQEGETTLENFNNGGKISVPDNLQSFFGGKSSVSLDEFNEVYSDAINAKKFTNLAQFKKNSGLIGRLFGLWGGETLGQVVSPGLGGKIIGGATGEIMSSNIPSILRTIGETAASTNPGNIVPGAKILTGAVNQPNP